GGPARDRVAAHSTLPAGSAIAARRVAAGATGGGVGREHAAVLPERRRVVDPSTRAGAAVAASRGRSSAPAVAAGSTGAGERGVVGSWAALPAGPARAAGRRSASSTRGRVWGSGSTEHGVRDRERA